jgi:protein-serine/threonine kinase
MISDVPLEIHMLDYLRRGELKPSNIVEVTDFFEDYINYYIKIRTNMEESECKNIFLQVVDVLHHLHTKALVVYRDIKDENIILDSDSKVKLANFGSAVYIKNCPFNVFVGTIAC